MPEYIHACTCARDWDTRYWVLCGCADYNYVWMCVSYTCMYSSMFCVGMHVDCTLVLQVPHISPFIVNVIDLQFSVQTLEFIANMQEGEKVLIFTGRKIT